MDPHSWRSFGARGVSERPRSREWREPAHEVPPELRADIRTLEADRDEFQRKLHEAEALIEALEAEVRFLAPVRGQGGRTGPEQDNVAGASRTRLLVRARTLVRRALHPDARPSSEAARATREFQATENLFTLLMERAR